MHEVIDESLKLASCSINDLTFEQASSILSKLGDGVKLGTLTLFFDYETGYLVLNKDHEQYDFYLKLAKFYLPASEKKREKFREECDSRIGRTLRVMDYSRECSRVQSDLSVIGYQDFVEPYNYAARGVLISLEKRHISTNLLMSQAYLYGVMNGKRMERARRKVVQA